MGEMFSKPTGKLLAQRLHDLALFSTPTVPQDRFGLVFPDRDRFADLHPAMQREAALLALESGAEHTFAECTGETAICLAAAPACASAATFSDDIHHGDARAARADMVADRAGLLVRWFAIPAEAECRAAALFRHAKGCGFDPGFTYHEFHDFVKSALPCRIDRHGTLILTGLELRVAAQEGPNP